MRRLLRHRPSPAMVVAVIALFVALGGTSYAGVMLSPNIIKSLHIANGQVKKKDIAQNAVRSGKIKNGTVKEPDLRSGAVTNSKLGDGAVTSSKLGDGAVTSSKLGDGAVTSAKIGDGSVTPSKIGTTPAARVYHNANQAIPGDASFTTLTFDSERFDTSNLHNPGTNPTRLTAPVAGLYLVTANISWEGANSAGAREIAINKNGGTIVARVVDAPSVSPNTTEQTITTLVQLAAGDYVEVVLRQNSAAPLNVLAAPEFSPEFSAVWIAPAT